jgi:hypothetical protein
VSILASSRPDSWNFPLFVHVFGAIVLVGAASLGVTALFMARRSEDPDRLRRLAFWTLLVVAVPAWFAMRGGAEWIHSKEFGSSPEDPDWIGIGYTTSEGGGLFLLVSLILSGIGSRRGKPGLATAGGVVLAVALAAWLVTVWAMGAKPG